MKKAILLLIAAIAVMGPVSAQNSKVADKKYWIDLQLVQHIGLNKWNDAGYINDGYPSASITEIRGTVNLYLAKPTFGAFADMGIGIMPAPNMKSFDLNRMPMPNHGTQYYLREMVSETGVDNASASFKITAGFFANINLTERLNIMPYIGYGGLIMPRRTYEMILKEEGSNNQYNTRFSWGMYSGEDSYSNSEMLGYWTVRLNFKYKIGQKSSLLFGLEYTHFDSVSNFYGKYSNTFNSNVQKRFMVDGNNMNMLGLSVGITWR